MSEHNYAGLLFKDNLRKNPDLFGHIGPDGELSESLQKQLAASAKERQARDAKNTEMRNTAQELRKEYNQLRQQLFDLKQWVHSSETRLNESAGQIRNIEQQFNSLLEQKKATESPKGQHNIERTILRLETELTEEKKKHKSLSLENESAVRQLKAFDVSRIDALKAELEAPKVITK